MSVVTEMNTSPSSLSRSLREKDGLLSSLCYVTEAEEKNQLVLLKVRLLVFISRIPYVSSINSVKAS